MLDVYFLETPISHISDRVTFYEGTGFFADSYFPSLSSALQFNASVKPLDLKILNRGAELVLKRRNPPGMIAMADGRAQPDDMEPPDETTYAFEGVVSDPAGEFNPRTLKLQVGGRNGHQVALYRSPQGTSVPAAGAVQGTVVYDNGAPASWALLAMTVTPTLGEPLAFRAQADVHGDFVMPLGRMPALNKDAVSASYSAVLSVTADGASGREVSAPDEHSDYQISDIENGSFVDTVNLSVVPGSRKKLTSAGQRNLVLKPA